ncbi:Acyl-CoA synthetase (AMP-forming)/AMP-acid ligase II [Streptomyces sp. cf386]|uniref:AMP-binding protein n=1 Tax=Streptomyces sp. cf386 TaxID=1761904 RepID=UPI00088E342D|nr:AMP-binding protein [Streptomyces sp. cf386]SDO98408.1 Acyl-CoA synthetase (AMP-forming)/AMP-acid ligase II [Streptomyces sp. cf386]
MPFTRGLAAYGDRVALITPDEELSYRRLADRVTATAERLGPVRRLVLLAGGNRADALVTYLAALSAGHPVLLVPGDSESTIRSLTEAYAPDVVARPHADGTWALDERHPESAHTLHPDLALLLSTSGSTGSPKLVRLSHENLQANAESIATYLGIDETDRAATTLPMHYCYGLSVIHSHLLRGAGLILTERSVSEAAFWEEFRAGRGTSLAGVPYTFDLLDRVGFERMELPQLRRVTQAGGRLAPERVARYAELGRRSGWELFVMYGQTEATARMAYLPPQLAAERPEAVGVPIPGGSFRLQPADGHSPDVGELVYSGPNVMLGYAESPADLALGRTVQELHTGDLARRASDGLYEIVGRRSRFAKILGLRIDPQRVESLLAEHGVTAYCAGDGEALAVAALGSAGEQARIRRLVAEECGLPSRAIRVRALDRLPRLATGKPNYEAVRRLTRPPEEGPPGPGQDLRRLYAEILDHGDVSEDSSFVSLGGDSLCYVEMSLRLEEALGHLPTDWHTRTIRELQAMAAPAAEGTVVKGGPEPRPARPTSGLRRALHAWSNPQSWRTRRTLETGIALRAVGIVLIVGSHVQVFEIKGFAHILICVAGYNFARFQLTYAARRERVRHMWRSTARIAVPSMVWITGAVLLTDFYDPANAVLLNSVLDQGNDRFDWAYWFVEALVYFLVVLAALMAVPLLDRLERRFAFGVPLVLMIVGLVGRYDLLGLASTRPQLSPTVVFWLFALGWAAARACTVRQRALLTAMLLLTLPGLFQDQPLRTTIVLVGLGLLIWIPTLPSLGPLNTLAGVLASSSLYIYLTHYQVYPYLQEDFPLTALFASLLVGVGYAAVVTRATRTVRWL